MYIHELVSVQSLDLIDNMGDVIAYFASSCGSYIFYAVVCAALGVLVNVAAESVRVKAVEEATDEKMCEFGKTDEKVQPFSNATERMVSGDKMLSETENDPKN